MPCEIKGKKFPIIRAGLDIVLEFVSVSMLIKKYVHVVIITTNRKRKTAVNRRTCRSDAGSF